MKKLICSGNSGRTDELSESFLSEQIRIVRGLIVGTDKNSAPFSVEQISVLWGAHHSSSSKNVILHFIKNKIHKVKYT